MSKYDEAMQAMTKQFGQDTFLSLATMDGRRSMYYGYIERRDDRCLIITYPCASIKEAAVVRDRAAKS